MGMPKQVIKLLLEENNYKPISGDFISFGKQTVSVGKDELVRLLGQYSHDTQVVQTYYDDNQLDTKSRHGVNNIEDENVLKMFSDINYNGEHYPFVPA